MNSPQRTLCRAALAKGLKDGKAGVDREARTIRGYSVISRGEAQGHGFWIDSAFLDATVQAGNALKSGAKSRFTHPGLCSDGLGKYLGRSVNFRRDGDQVRADLVLAGSASKTPSGDLAEYVMTLAEEDPSAFGASIVFERDIGSEEEFNGSCTDPDGNFQSPDPDNQCNYRHARLGELLASDVVDEPAANANGFFGRGSELAARAESALDWLFGLTDAVPAEMALDLGVEPERAREFLRGYLQRHQLAAPIIKLPAGKTARSAEPSSASLEGGQMADPVKPRAADPAPAAPPSDPVAEFAAKHPEAVEAFRAEGVKRSEERFAALAGAFKDRPQFVIEQFAQGADVAKATLALKDVLLAEKDAEIARLKTAAEAPKPAGAAPAQFSLAADLESGAGDFLRLSEELAKKEGLTLDAAMRQIDHDHPELREKFLNRAR